MRKRVLAIVLAVALCALCLPGCGAQQSAKQVKLDPSNPVSIKVWHYYNGVQQSTFDQLVSEFNATEGKEAGISVQAYTLGSISDLETAMDEAQAGAVGAKELPNVFSAYADTAYSLQKEDKLVNLSEYISDDELSRYVDGYVEEGRFAGDNSLYLFPLAKATETMMLNKTAWDEFAQATGSSLDELKTVEGIAAVAKRYYEWTDARTPEIPNDGKAFYGRDSMANYFYVCMKQMGTDLLSESGGTVVVNADKEKIRRLWDNYYIPMISGYFDAQGKFRSDDVKTGDIICYTGSTASAAYFPDQVVQGNESSAIDYSVLSAPVMKGGSNVQSQQGAGMAVLKTDDEHDYASTVFLKWLTQKENNIRFALSASYLPVLKEANSMDAIDQVVEENQLSVNQKSYATIQSVTESLDSTQFYSGECPSVSNSVRKVLTYNLSDKASADRKAVEAALALGSSLEQAIAPYTTDAAFDEWYENFTSALNGAAGN